MSNKTRKHIWPVALMSLAVLGVLAAVVALSAVQPQSAQAHGCDSTAMTAAEFAACDRDHRAAGLDHTTDHEHMDNGNGNGNGDIMPVTEDHASMPVMFMAEGLDNGARLSWAQPKLRAPGASVIGYRIGRDAWTSDPDHPINRFGDDVIDLLNLPSVLAADYSDRGLAYNTVYTYAVRAIVEYDVKYWWNNLTPAMRTSLVSSSEGMAYAGLSEDVMAAVQRVYGLQAGKYPTAMVDTWWDNLNCVQMNDAVSPREGEPAVGSDDPDNNPRSPYCYMYDDLSPAAAAVVYRAHYNSYNRYAFGTWSYGRSITTATSGGLLDALLAPPSAPRDLDAMPSCDDQIMITWKAPVDNGKVPAEFPGCATCTNRTPTHIGGDDAGIEIQPGTARITGYMVDRKVGNGAWMTLDSNVTGTSYVDDSDDLTYGMTYHYRVRATNNANLTGPAGMVSETLERPMGAQVPTSPDADPSPDNPAHVLFTWDPPGTAAGNAAWRTEDDVDTDNDNESKSMSYEIQRQRVGTTTWMTLPMAGHTEPHRYLESAATAAEAIDNIQTQEFVDENVPATGAYKYRVRAIIDLCEPSEWAVTAEEVTVTLELGNASGLTATAGSVPGIVNLSWTAAPNASVHWLAGIKQSDWTAGNYTGIIWTQTQGPSSHILSGLTSGEEYVFAVIGGRSVNGPWSSWTSLMRVTPN